MEVLGPEIYSAASRFLPTIVPSLINPKMHRSLLMPQLGTDCHTYLHNSLCAIVQVIVITMVVATVTIQDQDPQEIGLIRLLHCLSSSWRFTCSIIGMGQDCTSITWDDDLTVENG
jgi:hypothetical protein